MQPQEGAFRIANRIIEGMSTSISLQFDSATSEIATAISAVARVGNDLWVAADEGTASARMTPDGGGNYAVAGTSELIRVLIFRPANQTMKAKWPRSMWRGWIGKRDADICGWRVLIALSARSRSQGIQRRTRSNASQGKRRRQPLPPRARSNPAGCRRSQHARFDE